jgi:uncharacterized protein YqeY
VVDGITHFSKTLCNKDRIVWGKTHLKARPLPFPIFVLLKNNINMSLESIINEDLKTAMKAKDQASLRGIRAIKSAIMLFKTSGTGEELTPDKEIALLQKLVKQRQDSLDIYAKQGRQDLATVEEEEIGVIMRYLPKQLSEDELREAVQAIINRVGATSMKDMGRVMGEATKELAGKADGKAVSAVVKTLLG